MVRPVFRVIYIRTTERTSASSGAKVGNMELRLHPRRTTKVGSVQSDSMAPLVAISGETEKRLQAFARIYANKKFSKHTAYEAFAGVSRKKAP